MPQLITALTSNWLQSSLSTRTPIAVHARNDRLSFLACTTIPGGPN